MICDICSDDNPKYWAYSYKLEEELPICKSCFQREQPDKWREIENDR